MTTIDIRYVTTSAGSVPVELRSESYGYSIWEDGNRLAAIRGGAGAPEEHADNARFAFDVLTGRLATPRAVTPFPWRLAKPAWGDGYDIEASGPDGPVTIGHSGDLLSARSLMNSSERLASHPAWEAQRSRLPAMSR